MHLGGYNGFYMMWDPTYILILVGVVLSMLASARVKSTFSWFSRVRSMSGLTGAQTAQRILDYAGIRDVRIVPISGSLTDHYDPGEKTSGSFGECVWTKFRGGHCSGGTRMWSCITACQSLCTPFHPVSTGPGCKFWFRCFLVFYPGRDSV